MNFNFSKHPEYNLHSSVSNELIELYGILVKFLDTERVNLDNVFGDFSHLKSNSTDVMDVWVLPENTEDWDSSGYNLTAFGPINFENTALFIHKDSLPDIEVQHITGNLLIFPNNKIMEIVDTEFTVPGINNLFTTQDAKSIYKLTCTPYDYKLVNELDTKDIQYSSDNQELPLNPEYSNSEEYKSLEHYFDELIDRKDTQEYDTQDKLVTDAVEAGSKIDEQIKKPIVDTSQDDVWGKFG